MKELSIEEKAKVYDEVLKKARLFYKDEHVDNEVNSALEVLFPELKESEDEMILKHLKAVVKAYDMWAERGLDMNDILAWLEKKGEQKSAVIIPKFKVGDTIKDPYGDTYHIIEIGDDSYKTDDGRFILFANEDAYTRFNPAWSEEDKNRFTNLISLVKCSKENDATKVGFIEFINKLKSLEPQSTWKPSDEQMKFLWKYAEQNNYDGSILTSLYNDLEKLRKE